LFYLHIIMKITIGKKVGRGRLDKAQHSRSYVLWIAKTQQVLITFKVL